MSEDLVAVLTAAIAALERGDLTPLWSARRLDPAAPMYPEAQRAHALGTLAAVTPALKVATRLWCAMRAASSASQHATLLGEVAAIDWSGTEMLEPSLRAALLFGAGRREEAFALAAPHLDAPTGRSGDSPIGRTFADNEAYLEWRWATRPHAKLAVDDPLLAEVDWASLGTSYGRGARIPYWLRAVTGDDDASRKRALAYLVNELVHQGSIAAATKPVVKVLVALAARDLAPRATIAELFAGEGALRRYLSAKEKASLLAPPKSVVSSGADGQTLGRIKKEGNRLCLYTMVDGLLDGPFKSWHAHPDHLAAEGTYARGKRVGSWKIYWHTRPALQEEGAFDEAGKKHGEWVRYEADGRVDRRETYAHGVLDGPFETYFKLAGGKAVLRERGEHKKGKREGAFVEHHPTGHKKREGTYRRGKEHGPFTFYDESGKRLRTVVYDDGVAKG